jgi:hypothetical protein
MSHRLAPRVRKLEAATSTATFRLYVPTDPGNSDELEQARKAAMAQGQILVVVSDDDMRL